MIKDNGFFSYGLTFSDYPWHYHDKQTRYGAPDHEKYVHSWKYLILMTLSKIILNRDQSLPYDEESMVELAKIENFVLDTYGSKDPDVTQIFTPSKQLHLKPNFKIDLSIIKTEISADKVPMEYLPIIFPEVNLNLLESIEPFA
jgi:hypothetical protein